MAKFLYASMAFIGLIVTGFGACHRLENPKTEYDDYLAVVSNDAIGRGWIPDFLPKSATEIVEQHRTDASFGYVAFYADDGDTTYLRELCRPMEYTEVKYFSSYPIWWPKELSGSTDESANLDFYLCEEYGVLTTIDHKRHYYWYIK